MVFAAGPPLRILHVEDVPADAELAIHELRKAGFDLEARRVETREAFLAALADFAPDLILSDYRLPEFDGMQALLLAKEHAPDVPVVITTGSVNEETAVACMKAGADDYVLKDALGHLPTAVQGALEKRRLKLERRYAEEASKASEERIRFALRSANVGIWDLDVVTGAVQWSEILELQYGLQPGTFPGTLGAFIERIHPGDRGFVQAAVEKALKSGGDFSLEHRAVRPDGTVRTMNNIGHAYVGAQGAHRAVGISIDISEQRRLEEQFRHSQKMEEVGRLAGGVAHDFNNLLTVIQGYGELLEKSVAGKPEEREGVDEILRAAARATALTRQLLAFSRQQVLETRVLDVGDVVAETEKMLRRLIGEDIEVAVVKAEGLGRVKADPGQVSQVLLNLAVNARDAMPDGGRLTIELLNVSLDAPLGAAQEAIPPGRYVEISMTDTGCGIDADTLGHIFEPFFTTKERGKGTGLGLSTVYGIVRQSGGYVTVRSAPGAGTTFRTYWPRTGEPLDSAQPSTVRSLRGTETVLVVEDESSVRNIAQALLRKRGYTVLVAEDGGAALELLAREPRPVHVLLTDVVMPGMNGRELASRVAAIHPSVKTILMSGYAAEVLTRVEAAGIAGFLPKPFSDRTLAAKVREVLDAPRA